MLIKRQALTSFTRKGFSEYLSFRRCLIIICRSSILNDDTDSCHVSRSSGLPKIVEKSISRNEKTKQLRNCFNIWRKASKIVTTTCGVNGGSKNKRSLIVFRFVGDGVEMREILSKDDLTKRKLLSSVHVWGLARRACLGRVIVDSASRTSGRT